jgi:hypothetical protein
MWRYTNIYLEGCVRMWAGFHSHRTRSSGGLLRTQKRRAGNFVTSWQKIGVSKCIQLHRVSRINWAVPWLGWLVAGLLLRRPGFATGSVHVGFVVDEVELWQVSLRRSTVFSCQYHSTVALHSNLSPVGWAIVPLVSAVQRRSLTPPTWHDMTLTAVVTRNRLGARRFM